MSKQAIKAQAIKSVDEALAENLKKAEEALIRAVELFSSHSGRKGPNRPEIFLKRLTMAQETITTLYREELVRLRGPIKLSLKKRTNK